MLTSSRITIILFGRVMRRYGEMAELVEGARLEIVCALIAYRGFESLSLRRQRDVASKVVRYVYRAIFFIPRDK